MFPFATATLATAAPDPAAFDVVTPTPNYTTPRPALTLAEQPWRMDHHEKARVRAAAFRATKLYPGPVGELLSRELLSFEELGLRLANGGPVMRAVDAILKSPLTP